MTSSLFNEALNDAKAIRAAAEERAKQQLLETMSPKLKKIVENTINQQMGLFEEEQDDDIDLDNLEQELADDTESSSSTNTSTSQMSEDEDLGEIDLNEDEVEECGQNYSMESDDSNNVNESTKKVLNILLTKDVLKRNLQKEVKSFEKDVKALKNMFTMIESHKVNQQTVKKVDQTLLKLVENSKNIASNDIIKNQTQIKIQFSNALQELNQMTRRRNNILAENYASLARRSRRLFEAEGDEEETDDLSDVPALEDEGSADTDDAGEDMDFNASADKLSNADADQLDDIAKRIRDMLNGEGGEEDMDMGDEEDMDMGGEEDMDMGDEEEDQKKNEWARRRGRLFAESEMSDDLDEEEYCEEDEELKETDSYFFEADKSKTKSKAKSMTKSKTKSMTKSMAKSKTESQNRRGDVFLEIDENMLKREIARMKKLREGDAEDMISHFGGAKSEGEPFLDFDDSDLNGNVGNLGSFPSKGGRLKEGRSYNSNGQTRLLEGQVQNYKKALTGMKNQLSEMTLFNAKLLYANKLMQNRDLTNSQQRHIVESLDQAKNLREAQLLFEGLSKSLSKGTGRSGSLNESASRRIIGGSSRSTSSAQSAQNRIETDRWAILAGIKK